MQVSEILDAFGLTQDQLSAFTGIPRHRIAKWNTGKASPKTEDSRVLDKVEALFKGKSSQEIKKIIAEGSIDKHFKQENEVSEPEADPGYGKAMTEEQVKEMQALIAAKREQSDRMMSIITHKRMTEDQRDKYKGLVYNVPMNDILQEVLFDIDTLMDRVQRLEMTK
jgi:transcriptional regulator with XRE-family HTH domain